MAVVHSAKNYSKVFLCILLTLIIKFQGYAKTVLIQSCPFNAYKKIFRRVYPISPLYSSVGDFLPFTLLPTSITFVNDIMGDFTATIV